MPKYRTTTPMYLPDDRYVGAGVIVGDDTEFPLPEGFRPSRTMEAVDDEAQEEIDAVKDGESQENEEGIAARLERENRQLQQENAQLKAQLSSQGQSGMEPWAPETDTGPSPHQANIGKTADGRDRVTSTVGNPQVDEAGRTLPARIDTPIGASSTTPPKESIQLPTTKESSRPVARRLSGILDEQGRSPPADQAQDSETPENEVGGPQTGVDDPSPMAQAGSETDAARTKVAENDTPEGEQAKPRPGDQSDPKPNKNLAMPDTETFMPNNEPNAPNAPGPAGAKNQLKKK